MENEIIRPYVKKDNKKTILLVTSYVVLTIIIVVEAVMLLKLYNANNRLGELCSGYEEQIKDKDSQICTLESENKSIKYESKIETEYETLSKFLDSYVQYDSEISETIANFALLKRDTISEITQAKMVYSLSGITTDPEETIKNAEEEMGNAYQKWHESYEQIISLQIDLTKTVGDLLEEDK